METKQCRSCKQIKSLFEYHKNKNTKDNLCYNCKNCNSLKSKKWYIKNKEKVMLSKTNRRKNIINSLLESAQNRARIKNIYISITKEDIIVPDYCPILGLKLEKSKNIMSDNSPSLDRINPKLGYIKNNIQVISNKANTMKSNATYEELILFAKWINKNITISGEDNDNT